MSTNIQNYDTMNEFDKQNWQTILASAKTEGAHHLMDKNCNAKLRCGLYNVINKTQKKVDVCQPQFALVYFLKASGRFTDSTGKQFPIEPGGVMLRLPDQKHTTIINAGQSVSCFIAVPGSFYNTLLAIKAITPNTPTLFNIGFQISLIERFKDLITHLKQSDINNYFDWLSDAQKLIYDILMLRQTAQQAPKQNISQEACRLLESSLFYNRSLEEIAKELHVSYSYLRKLFKKQMGLSMEEYRIQQKVEQAKTMLIEQTLDIKEISEKLAYYDVHSFSNQFKKQTGISPGEFRSDHLVFGLGGS